MGFLAGKRLLITGVLSNRSIAYGIARACRREGAELAFSYQGERFKERITEFAAEFGSTLVFDCDVADDAQIDAPVRRSSAKPGPSSTASCTRSASRRAKRSPATSSTACRARRSASRTTSRPTASRRMAKAAAAAAAPERGAADADLPRRAAQRAELQHDGPRQGLARGQRALPRRQPRPEGRARQRHLGRADQDARRVGHQGLRQDARRRRAQRRRCAAT